MINERRKYYGRVQRIVKLEHGEVVVICKNVGAIDINRFNFAPKPGDRVEYLFKQDRGFFIGKADCVIVEKFKAIIQAIKTGEARWAQKEGKDGVWYLYKIGRRYHNPDGTGCSALVFVEKLYIKDGEVVYGEFWDLESLKYFWFNSKSSLRAKIRRSLEICLPKWVC
jgi:hypothetical protein